MKSKSEPPADDTQQQNIHSDGMNAKQPPGQPMTLGNMLELQRGANVSRKSARLVIA
jgi:hypothetical protein